MIAVTAFAFIQFIVVIVAVVKIVPPTAVAVMAVTNPAGTALLVFTVVWLVSHGIGVWGNNNTVGWGFDIINFVWWIGIGHAGTLISASCSCSSSSGAPASTAPPRR